MNQKVEYQHTGFVKNFRLFGFATGSYHGICPKCKRQFFGDKLSISCLSCAIEFAEEQNNKINNLKKE